ncbi:MAG TPA: DUF2934 domain-containing protein [Candidatus Angelobacter sp.]
MAEKTTGRTRKGTKKAAKQPIPIDTGVSQSSPGTVASRSAATQVSSDNNPATQAYPGIEEEIRLRAYELYVERGRQDGFQEEDWSRAETEILSRHQREKSA